MDKFDQKNWELMTRILTGEANVEERRKFRRWVKEDPQRLTYFKELQSAWNSELDEDSANASFLFDLESGTKKLRKKIHLQEKIRFKNSFAEPINKRSRYAWKIAALIFFIVVVASVFGIKYYWSPPTTTYQTTNVEQRIITLPDGSKVHLNRNSSIKFPKGFKKKRREITLKGEAFFDVKHDSLHPFIVNAGRAVIQDIGTSFNVKQEESGQLVVIVKDGMVSLKNKRGEKQNIAIIKQNHLGKLISGGSIQVEEISIANYLSWINGQLVFKKMPLKQVASQLENIYGIQSKFSDENLASLKLTAFTHKLNINEVLNMIAFSLDLQYQKRGDTIIWKK